MLIDVRDFEGKLCAMSNPSQPNTLQVKYEDTTARYASHVMLNVSHEECYLDFSSGVVGDKVSGVPVMPIHTRIVMSPGGAKRLHQLLGRALQEQQNKLPQPGV